MRTKLEIAYGQRVEDGQGLVSMPPRWVGQLQQSPSYARGRKEKGNSLMLRVRLYLFPGEIAMDTTSI